MTTTVFEGASGADEAVRAAHAAFLEARTRTREERASWLEAIADELEAHREELVGLAGEDTHLPEARLNGELTRSAFQLRLLADEVRTGAFLDATIDHADPDWGMGPRPDLRRINVPLGVVGVFGASNFPFAFSVMGGDSASALAAGCAVVHKVHDAHVGLGRRTVELVVDALARAGAPDGLFSGLIGLEAGTALVDHPLTRAIGFTGSERVGRLLLDRAAARPEPIPFYGELGSINPVVVTPAAWRERADEILSGFVASMTLGLGQFCTKPGLLFLPAEAAERAREQLPALLRDAPVGAGAMLSDGVREGFLHNRELVQDTPGVEVLLEGGAGDPPSPALFAANAGDLDADSPVLTREMFGPAGVVVAYASEAELLATLNRLPGQLTGGVHGADGEAVGAIASALTDRAGRVLRDGWPTGVTVSYAQQHGGPYPATTSGTTSVGTAAVGRFLRPVAFQDFADADLPPELQEANPLRIPRRVDGVWVRAEGA
ncbi:aldehyde dehydrogenase (NADP(+)) [Microbacterium sp. JZ31]|uniref:aldehyde dehydrogenase (NADP(+)) n=1 Tax=Microbacterium sp. JZ31 TaxID=1906274 RepID=UPI00193323A8|nr:aldehyde dehydrogenase (NADP(+)) [Microbacterium sp. JZ31]